MSSNKILYHFGEHTEGSATMINLLGGKGANLAEMSKFNLPVPPGFTITTEVCNEFLALKKDDQGTYIDNLLELSVGKAIKTLRDNFDHTPLLSVRSGARESMPGMMDTVLNVGLTDSNLNEWCERIGKRATYDSYRRLIQMFGEVVFGIDPKHFKAAYKTIAGYKYALKAIPKTESDWSIKHFVQLIDAYKNVILKNSGLIFPQTLKEQLYFSIGAIFKSWNNDRAKLYRRKMGYSDKWGTAVTIQSMVFGNINNQSGSGVFFTRNPNTGEDDGIFGEYIINGQGEDVVSGTVTPLAIDVTSHWAGNIFSQLDDIGVLLENHFGDMQEIEFTVQNKELYILQNRVGKRSAEATFKIALNFFENDQITLDQLRSRVSGEDYFKLKGDFIDPAFSKEPQGTGLPASGSLVTGRVVFSSNEAVAYQALHGDCILLLNETTPNDLKGIIAAKGILTATGGLTSHAAVVARGFNKTCVVGCQAHNSTVGDNQFWVLNNHPIHAGDRLTIDGTTGNIWMNTEVPLVNKTITQSANTVLNLLKDKTLDCIERIDLTFPITSAGIPKKAYFTTLEDSLTPGILTDILLKADITYGVLDLSSFDDFFNKYDALYFKDLGLRSVEKELLERKIEVLTNTKNIQPLKQRLVLDCPHYIIESQKKELRSAGWNLVEVVDTLLDLLAATTTIQISDALESSIGSQETIENLIKICNQAGHDVKLMPMTVTRERLIFDALG